MQRLLRRRQKIVFFQGKKLPAFRTQSVIFRQKKRLFKAKNRLFQTRFMIYTTWTPLALFGVFFQGHFFTPSLNHTLCLEQYVWQHFYNVHMAFIESGAIIEASTVNTLSGEPFVRDHNACQFDWVVMLACKYILHSLTLSFLTYAGFSQTY